MSLVLALLLFSAPDAQWRHPAEDDANVAARMAVAEAVFPDAQPAYEASRGAVFVGVVMPGVGGIECAYGDTWLRSERSWEGMRLVCP
jgi:hypothetical protein